MSFSLEAKEELSKINNLANKELVKAELIGYLISINATIVNDKIKYATESEYNINRFSKLLNNVDVLNYEIEMQGKSFVITFDAVKIYEFVKIKENEIYIDTIDEDDEYVKAVIRGAYLGSGSMNNPQKKYHLEITLSCDKSSEVIVKALEERDIKIKNLDGKILYIKEAEEISKFLAFIGANKAVLKFEEIRVVRDMNNKVNRLVNCETANMNKTINTSVEQINAILKLKETKEFEKLDESLKEIAEIRLEHPDEPLSKLGNYLKEPIGKSGVNYRLRRIVEISKES